MTVPTTTFDPAAGAPLPDASQPLRGAWQSLATPDFARVDPLRTIALLPVSATEQHGPHLPLGTDAIINAGILDAAMQQLSPQASVVVLPPLEVGDSLEHSAFAGTLSVDLGPLLGLWCSIGRDVARAGVRKLVIFNSHGGQKAHVDQAALRLRVDHGMLVVRAHSFGLGVPPGLFPADELAHGIHGGAVETSLILHLRPSLVRLEAVADFPSRGASMAAAGGLLGAEKPVGIGWMTQDLNPRGACGDARLATAAKGRELLDHAAGQLVRLLDEVAAAPLPATAASAMPVTG